MNAQPVYEYKTVKVDQRPKQQSKELSKLSAAGWEIVSIAPTPIQIGFKIVPVQVRRLKP